MRTIVAGAFITLDGVMQAPGGPDEDREGGFEHGGWLVPYFDEAFARIMTDWTTRAGAFLLGRKTAEIFAASWPKATDPDDAIAAALNTRPKFVASRGIDRLDWQHATVIGGDVVEAVQALRRGEALGGLDARNQAEIQVHGSSDLLQTLLQHDLVDVLRLWLFPVVVGSGKRLFASGAIPRSFHLIEMEAVPTGAVLLVYQRVGGLRYGEVEVGEPVRVFDEAPASGQAKAAAAKTAPSKSAAAKAATAVKTGRRRRPGMRGRRV